MLKYIYSLSILSFLLSPTFSPATPLPPSSNWTVTASAGQAGEFPASNICDGKLDTRWSSPFEDGHWLLIDMGKPGTVCGFTLHWETAYAKGYRILSSVDSNTWTTLYATTEGDGRVDDIYITPTLARFLKIDFQKRGTGWGNSLWELEVKGADQQPRIEVTPFDPGSTATLMDGRLDTLWTASMSPAITLTFDLRREKSFGGLRIDWGEAFARDGTLYISKDQQQWTPISEFHEGTGAFDLLLHPAQTARYLRLNLMNPAAPHPGFTIRDISFRGPGESLSPLALYRIAAEKAPPGHYPEQLRDRQVYWTVSGIPGDLEESLFDEYGNLEPFARGPVLMPYLYRNGKLESALDAKTIEPTLLDHTLPLPSIQWTTDGLRISIDAFTRGTPTNSMTYVRYGLHNTDTNQQQSGTLYLAIRPSQIDPVWQHGGLSPIHSMSYSMADQEILINDQPVFIPLTSPNQFGATAYRYGDIVKSLARNTVPKTKEAEDPQGLASGALAYRFNLKPGGRKNIILAAPLHKTTSDLKAFHVSWGEERLPPAASFLHQRDAMRDMWKQQLGDVTFETGLPDIAHTVRAQMGYILINQDGDAIQPGSRNYNRTWMRDGSVTSAALMRMGLMKPARAYLEWYADRVHENGMVPPILYNDGTGYHGWGADIEYDSQGQFIFALMEYVRFSNDLNFLKKHFPTIVRALKFTETLRKQTLDEGYLSEEPGRERFIGILPPSISHEGYPNPVHSYWDDYWALRGWKDGIEAARLLKDESTLIWATAEYEAFKADLRKSIEATIAFFDIDYIPSSADKGDFDPTSTSIAFFPCGVQDVLPPELTAASYDRYMDDVDARAKPGASYRYTPYEVRNLLALVQLGKRDAAFHLHERLFEDRRPADWNHFAEVVISDPRIGSYIGDMPHTWVGAGYVNSIRGMIVFEDSNRLNLLHAVPSSWLSESGIVLKTFPTHFGTLDFTATLDNNRLDVTASGACNPEGGFSLRWPMTDKPSSVTLNGKPLTPLEDDGIVIPRLPFRLSAEWKIP